MGITATGTNGVSAGGIWSGLNKGLLMFSTSTGTGNGGAFGQVEKNTSYSMTGALTVAAEIDALNPDTACVYGATTLPPPPLPRQVQPVSV